ncbi:universal stress protein [Thiothrix eikelboomii]|uniref:universal stress protein n=1 Tax=Thiothrix eikelboomii TaxID=92487 RepID=UPI003BAE2ABC
MSDIYILAYDGSPAARRTAEFAAGRAKLAQAQLHIVHVLEWSPYSFLTQEELAERHQRRTQELERATQSILDPLVSELTAAGQTVTSEVRYGNVAKTINEIATEKAAKVIYVAKSNETGLASRLLGNVPSALIQIAAVPVVVVP